MDALNIDDDASLGENPNPKLIAIVGMGCRWPGGIGTPSRLWDFICAKKSAYQDFSDERFKIDGFHHKNSRRPGSMQSRGGYLLTEDPRLFDHAFFGVSGTEVASMDPAQRKILEVVYEAFENAGVTKDDYTGSKTGVFIGNFNNDHLLNQARDSDFSSAHASTGASASILSNRVNFVMDLRGPSVTVDTACSSSLFALHLAVNSIRQGDCESAIVGGSNLIMSPDVQLMLSQLGALSPTSTCHTFDASADGYARGEGVAAFYLVPLSEAMRCNYPVRAIIRGTAINSNGRSAGLTHPSTRGQEAVIRQAYLNAKLDPSETGYFEAHGTGTQVGDPIEVEAIGNVFGSSTNSTPLLIGSIKPNIGHTEATSGLAGLMKAILALEAHMIPPTRGFSHPNPKVDFSKANVEVATMLLPWPADRLRRASVNSFGYGGANAHCILDHISVVERQVSETNSVVSLDSDGSIVQVSVPLPRAGGSACRAKVQSRSAGTRRLVILPFSAQSEASLTQNIESTLKSISHQSLADVAYTLSSHRSRFRYRSHVIVEAGHNEKISKVFASEPKRVQESGTPGVAFVFTGQGAQWPAMGRTLFAYDVFRDTIARLDDVISRVSFRPDWRIQDVLSGAEQPSVDLPIVSQTVCTALQIGLVDLFRSWRILPAAVVGHSSGEIAAAYTSGHLTAEEAILIAYYRGVAVSKNREQGLMLAVGVGEDEARSHLTGSYSNVEIAASNSPSSVTLSGAAEEVTGLAELLQSAGVFVRILQTGGNAYHSRHMQALGLEYEVMLTQTLRGLSPEERLGDGERLQETSWISSVCPDAPISDAMRRPFYWRQNLESPVRFSKAIENMLTSSLRKIDLMIEVGPHSALKTPLQQIWAHAKSSDASCQFYYPTLVRGRDGMEAILQLCGSLLCVNVPLDMEAVNAEDYAEGGRSVLRHGQTSKNLPPYSFNYGPVLFNESRFSKETRLRRYVRHDILGARQPGCSKDSPSFRNVLRIKDVPWLAHHRLLPHAVFPAAGYIAMAIEAVAQTYAGQHCINDIHRYVLQNVSIQAAMRIPEDDHGIEIILDLQQQQTPNGIKYRFRISSVTQPDDAWFNHCAGEIVPHLKPHSEKVERPEKITGPRDPRILSSKKWYQTFAETGLGYGSSFQAISHLTSDPQSNTVAATISLDTTREVFEGEESRYLLHPASLDACFQLAIIAGFQGHNENAQNAFVPVFLKRITVWVPERSNKTSGSAVCQSTRRGIRGLYAQIQLSTQSGTPIADIEGLRCVAYGERSKSVETVRKPYRNLVWKPDISRLDRKTAYAMFTPSAVDSDFVVSMDNLARLSAYTVVEIAMRYEYDAQGPQSPPHIEHFLAWTRRCARSSLPFIAEALSTTSACRVATMTELAAGTTKPEVQLIKRIFDHLEAIVAGIKTGLEVALQDELLGQLYTSSVGIAGAYPQLRQIVKLCAFRNPHLDILEVGAGTGGATREVLDALRADSAERLFNHYTFTDISTAFLTSAKSQFTLGDSMAFGTFDVEKDPLEQGYEQNYDLVIASESLHTSTNIEQALRFVWNLLRPGGALIIVETTQTSIGHGLVLGTFPDYWTGSEEHRVDGPFMNADQWDIALRAAGFSGVEIQLDDYPEQWKIASVFMSTKRPSDQLTAHAERNSVALIAEGELKDLAHLTGSAFRDFNVSTELATGHGAKHDRVVWFIDAQRLWRSESRAWLEAAKRLVEGSQSILWVTTSHHVEGLDPDAAIIAGLVRVISAEYPQHRHAIIDVPADTTDEHIAAQLAKLEIDLQHAQLIDREWIWRNGCLHISRLVPDLARNVNFASLHSKDVCTKEVPLEGLPPFKVAYERPGILHSLFFKEDDQFRDPLPDHFIVARTEAMGLNWKDLAVATGRFDLDNASTEFSGVVTEVGPNVSHLEVGDRVYGFAFGHFGNYVRTPASFVRRIPQGRFFNEMATVPVVYASALYALKHLGRLGPQDSVLIQSATGGLGIAAMNVAQSIGATIFATAGSEKKRAFLQNTFDIPADRIFDSRQVPSSGQFLQATSGAGFDVVLNTSSGLIMDASWSAIAPQGRFVDVGRVDVHDHGTLSLEPFNRNASFSSFDLGRLDADLLSELLGELDSMMHINAVRPIDRVTELDISELSAALLKLSEGKHIGKLIVTYQNPKSLIRVAPSHTVASFDSNAVYVVAGGLGGLGRSLIAWMVDRGARHLVSLSRKADVSPEVNILIENMHKRGAFLELIACDITDREWLQRTIGHVLARGVIKGVVHAAMALHDKLFSSLSLEEWEMGLGAKVQGTTNLHDVTAHLPLDFFVLTSSISTQIAQPTQGAYCAANSFQDYFARYRRSLGLPATTIAFGLIHEAGELRRRIDVQNSMSRNDLYGTGEAEFLRLLEAAFLPDPSIGQQGYDPLSTAHVVTSLEPALLLKKQLENKETGITTTQPRWHGDARFSHLLREMENAASSAQAAASTAGAKRPSFQPAESLMLALENSLRANDSNKARELVLGSILNRIADMLFTAVHSLDASLGVSAYGIDSLVAAELRSWFLENYKCSIPFLKLLDPRTSIENLADLILEHWTERQKELTER